MSYEKTASSDKEVTPRPQPTSDGSGSAGAGGSVLRPAVDIFEDGDGITVKADMPGVSKDRLDVRIEGNSLLIEGTVGIEPQEQMSPLYADIRSTTYRRDFVLGNELETTKIEAHLRDGLLTVRIPKRAELRPRRIDVTS